MTHFGCRWMQWRLNWLAWSFAQSAMPWLLTGLSPVRRLVFLVNRRTSVRFTFGWPLSSRVTLSQWFVDTVLIFVKFFVTLPPTINETFKMAFSPLPILMQNHCIMCLLSLVVVTVLRLSLVRWFAKRNRLRFLTSKLTYNLCIRFGRLYPLHRDHI